MGYTRLKLNLYIKARGVAKIIVFWPFLERFPVISLFYREYFIVGLITQFLIGKIKLLTLIFQTKTCFSICSFYY